jgi:ferredoxin
MQRTRNCIIEVPEVFAMDETDEKAIVIQNRPPDSLRIAIETTILGCPERAISRVESIVNRFGAVLSIEGNGLERLLSRIARVHVEVSTWCRVATIDKAVFCSTRKRNGRVVHRWRGSG